MGGLQMTVPTGEKREGGIERGSAAPNPSLIIAMTTVTYFDFEKQVMIW
jgi:hypothetical protein